MIDLRKVKKTATHTTFAIRESVNREQRRGPDEDKEALYAVTIGRDGSATFGNITGQMSVENAEHFLQSVIVCMRVEKETRDDPNTEEPRELSAS